MTAFLSAIDYAWWAVVAYLLVLAFLLALYLMLVWTPERVRRWRVRRSPWWTALRHGVRRAA